MTTTEPTTIWRARCPTCPNECRDGGPERPPLWECGACGRDMPWERWAVDAGSVWWRNPEHGGLTTFAPGVEPPKGVGWRRVTKRTLRRVK